MLGYKYLKHELMVKQSKFVAKNNINVHQLDEVLLT